MSYKEYTVKVCDDGTKFWYLNDENYSEEDFLKKTSPIKEYTVADLEKLLGHPLKVIKG